MRITIYGHEDPRNGIIRYVGQTENVYRRFIEHISFEKPVEPKDYWIQELKDLNLSDGVGSQAKTRSDIEGSE
jgi:hypothetical protein